MVCENKTKTSNNPTVMLRYGTNISPSHEAKPSISNTFFSPNTCQAFIFQKIKNPLLSIGTFCDDKNIALFTQDKCIILNDISKLKRIQALINIITLLEGTKDPVTKL